MRLGERTRALREVFGDDRVRVALERERTLAAITTGEVEGLYRLDDGVTRTLVEQGLASDAALRLETEEFDLIAAHRHASTVVTDSIRDGVPVTALFVRELHDLVTAGQPDYVVRDQLGREVRRPLPHGEYKPDDNHVELPDGTIHHYAPAADVPSEVTSLIEILRRRDDENTLVLAALAHHRLTQIHPFADGNGRTARLLATYYLVRGGLLALTLETTDKAAYLRGLRAADAGGLGELIAFLLGRQSASMARLERQLTALEGYAEFDEYARTLAAWSARRRDLAAGADVERDGVYPVAKAMQQQLLATLTRALAPFAERGFDTSLTPFSPGHDPNGAQSAARRAGLGTTGENGVTDLRVDVAIGTGTQRVDLMVFVVALTDVWPPSIALVPSTAVRALVGEPDELLDELAGSWSEEVVAPVLADFAARL